MGGIRRHLITAAVVLGLALLVLWIAQNTYWKEVDTPRTLQGRAATEPFYGAQLLATRLGARTQWRHDTLELPPPDGVILTGAFSLGLLPGRAQALQDWVRAGGRLVLDAQLAGGGELASSFGISRVYVRPPADAPPPADRRHFVTTGPQEAGADPWMRRDYDLCCMTLYRHVETTAAPTWSLRDAGSHALVGARVPLGAGSVTYIDGTPFGTTALLSDSHALLLADALQLRHRDTLLLLSDAAQPTLLALLWRTGWPLIVLLACAVALSLWRAAPRFGPLEAPPARARRSLAEQIRGTGQFAFAHGGARALHSAVLAALREAAAPRIRGFALMGTAAQAQALAALTAIPAAQLERALAPAVDARRRELSSSLAVLEHARRALPVTSNNHTPLRTGHE